MEDFLLLLVSWTHNDMLTEELFMLQSHKCVAVFEGHSSKVSCLLVSTAPCLHHRLYSGSSDQTIRCYSLKVKTANACDSHRSFKMLSRVFP